MPTAALLIQGGTLIDPANGIEEPRDVLVENGKVAEVKRGIAAKGATVIDARGKIVCPGLIDIHVHFREPGDERKETIATGADSAIAGGFTTVCCMPNTKPALDNQAQLEFVLLQAARAGKANVLPISAVTRERKGQELTEMGLNVEAGAVAFSDDGSNIDRADVMKNALLYATRLDKVIIVHAEDSCLTGGVMNAGYPALKMGHGGIPREAEDVIVARDILLSRMTGGRLHIAHISSGASVDMVRRAKRDGIAISCETAPHYFTYCDSDVEQFGTMLKMSPPVRTAADRDAIIEGLRDGTIEVIASDHAPHTDEQKALGMEEAPFGIIGLETMIPVSYTELVQSRILTLPRLLATLTSHPARILGLSSKGHLAPGADGDVTVLDIDTEWTIDKSRFRSKSRNCPFHGRRVRGQATDVIVGGRHFKNS